MARYWVGGTGTWDASTTTHWSASSGGAGGSSVPTSSDDVIFDSSSNATAYTVTRSTGTANCLSLTVGAPASGKITFAGANTLQVSGSFNLTGGTAGITWTFTGQMVFYGTGTITTNGVPLTSTSFTIDATASTLTLGSDLVFTSTSSYLTLTNGTLTCVNGSNNYAITVGGITTAGTLILGSATHTIIGVSSVSFRTTTGTVNAGTSTLHFTDTSNTLLGIQATGATPTLYNMWFDRGTSSGIIAFINSISLNDLKDTGTVAHTLRFNPSITLTTKTFTVNGNPGQLITLTSSTTSTYNLVKTGGGTINCTYLNIAHSVATPANTWYADFATCVNSQSTATAGSGWSFMASALTPIQATRDENNIPALLAVYNGDGSSLVAVKANPTNHGIKALDGTTGGDNGPTRALRDGNFVTTLIAVSSADGVTPVAVYADVNGNLLMKST